MQFVRKTPDSSGKLYELIPNMPEHRLVPLM